MVVRRARGVILRVVRQRRLAVAVGAAMVAPAAWVEFISQPGVWWLNALSLVLGATGAALLWAGLRGPRADWIDDTSELRSKK
jgi:hypothetical protein